MSKKKSVPTSSTLILDSAPGAARDPRAVLVKDAAAGSIKGADVVLIADAQALPDAVAMVSTMGPARIFPVDPSSPSLADTIDQAMAHTVASRKAGRVPSMSLLKQARTCAATIPAGTFGPMAEPIEAMARLAGAPPEFIAAWVMSITSGLMTGRFMVEVRPEFEVAPVVWTACVGDASSNKSPAGNITLKPIRTIEQEYRRRRESEVAAARQKGDRADSVPPARRLVASNASIEALQALASSERRGLLGAYDELSDWFNALRRYSRGSSTGDRGAWLAAHNGFPLTIDRKALKGESLHIPCWGVALAGGIPGSVLSSLSDSAELESGDGLDLRLWYFAPPPAPLALRPLPGDAAQTAAWHRIVERLFEMRAQAVPAATIEFTPEARAKFESWRYDLIDGARQSGQEVSGWTGKLPGAVARICGVLAAIDAAHSGQHPRQITPDILARAAGLAEVISAHRSKIQMMRGAPSIERLSAELAGYLIRFKMQAIDTFEIRRGGVAPGIRSEVTLRQVLVELDSAGWINEPISPRRDESLPRAVTIRPEVFELAAKAGL